MKNPWIEFSWANDIMRFISINTVAAEKDRIHTSFKTAMLIHFTDNAIFVAWGCGLMYKYLCKNLEVKKG